VRATTSVVFGAILYKTCLVAAMQLGLPTNYLKLLMAVIFTIALVSNNFFAGRRKTSHVNPTQI
jgi:putative ABC transport system permease protein